MTTVRSWAIAGVAVCVLSVNAAEPVSFSAQIQPIVQQQCAGCHQPAVRQSDLDLTTFEGFREGGRKGPGFVAGKPAESVVVRYLTGEAKPVMPFGGKPLPEEQIELFRRWIAEGAKDDTAPDAARQVPAEREPTVYKSPPLVNAVAFSPDGELLAVSGYHEILLHETSGDLLARLPGMSPRIHSILFSPDGATLVTVGGAPSRFGEVQVWDVAAREQRHSIVATNDTLFGGSLSPDGTKLACGAADDSVRLFDVVGGKEIRKVDHHEDWVFGTVFGIDGERLVSVSRDRAAKLTAVETGRFIENVNLLKEPLTAVARHPKKDWIVVGGHERVPYLYRMDRPRAMRIADDSTLIRKFETQDGPILAVAVSPDGRFVAVGSEVGNVRVYDTDSGERVASCFGHEGGIYAVEFHPSGNLLAAAGFDGQVRFYDIEGQLVRSLVPVPIEVAKRE